MTLLTIIPVASMRFDVPNVNDADGAYAGGAFFTTVGRDLSGYDALTFWAKSVQSAATWMLLVLELI